MEYHYSMMDLFILFTALTVFGVGVTIIDFLGIMDNFGDNDGNGTDETSGSTVKQGSNLIPENKSSNEKPGIRIVSRIMSFLRNIVYFSLGFGPTGLFASFTGLSKTTGLIWAFVVGTAMMILARFLKRFIHRDLDSSIKPDELLQEKGILLLPLEGGMESGSISKAVVRQYGREIEIYVRCRNNGIKLSKGNIIIIQEYDNDIYWVEPAGDSQYGEGSVLTTKELFDNFSY